MATLLLAAFLVVASTDARPTPHPLDLVARAFDARNRYANFPTYDQLPLHPSFPTKAAWGVWGASDEFGALNHITRATRLAARSEIQTGRAISLNLAIAVPDPPIDPQRPPLIHAIQPFAGYQDDVLTLNTQISTQFGGLRHFPYSTNFEQSTYQFYNDLITFDDIVAPGGTSTLGIQSMHAAASLRGKRLTSFWGRRLAERDRWARRSARLGRTIIIPTTELDAVARWQGLDPAAFTAPGDFLVVRTSFMKQYTALSAHAQTVLPFRAGAAVQWVGVEASDATLRWLWDKKVALVGADNPTFESAPLSGVIDGAVRNLHMVFIGGWGQSIVEFMDLEELAATCHALKRFHFFFTLQNLNVVGGIASPPNAMAIL
ncbi:hypothetical protein GGX14DRAFT_588782 [Mycena pura]|uniref:Cyclase n=1 Tax=Mycena pura TaxID=153505 RepID=A0AAD6UVW4_9AGAR|nr:hypothetical protein GGX14DRAFT_588782 [Mycena pura]